MAERNIVSGAPAVDVRGALDAPILYFDEVPAFGMNPSGVASVLLCTLVQDIDAEGKPQVHKKAVGQLRGSAVALRSLLLALQQLEAMQERPDGPAN